VADLADVTTAVVTVKVAVVAPAETVTDAGTATPTVLLDNETDRPPVGIVNTADLVEPLAAAEIVDSESVLTALVVTVKDAED